MASPNNDPQYLREDVRLFLSVDIVGSTAYKGRDRGDVQAWLRVFFDFHRELRIRLLNIYHRHPVEVDGVKLKTPTIWKSLGDEIVFKTEIRNHREAAEHVIRFKEAVRLYRSILQAVDAKLDLKAAAWVAGFPVANSVVRITKGDGVFEDDFVGPSMDIGFRISGMATPRKMVLSIELAYLLTKGRATPERPLLYFEEGRSLKGVLGGHPYPLIWTNMFKAESDELDILDDRLRRTLPRPCQPPELYHYCHRFIEEWGRPLFVPFIATDPGFNAPPEGYEETLAKTRSIWQVIYDDNLASEPAPTAQPEITADDLIALVQTGARVKD